MHGASIEATIRAPKLEDGPRLRNFVEQCGSLEPNSTYCYFLLSSHFAETCALAERDGVVLGYVAGYRIPARPDTLFVWQVGVSEAARGMGLAGKLIEHILRSLPDLRHVEATVSPANAASAALFAKVARRLNAPMELKPFLTSVHFGTEKHDPEVLHRIGPFNIPLTQEEQNP